MRLQKSAHSLVVALLFLNACHSRAENQKNFTSPATTIQPTPVKEPPAAREDDGRFKLTNTAENTKGIDEVEKRGQGAESFAIPSARMVIRNATLELRAEHPDELAQKAQKIIEDSQGFVISSDSYGGDKISQVSLVLRVPADSFDDVLPRLKALGVMLRESVSGQDVTAEYVDLEAQLHAQRAMETSFIDILKRAQTVEDALKVEAELGRIRTEIDRIDGRQRLLKSQSSLSTIHITALASYQPYTQEAESIGSKFNRAFEDTGRMLLEILLGLVQVVGVLLPLALLASPFFFWWRKARRVVALAPRATPSSEAQKAEAQAER